MTVKHHEGSEWLIHGHASGDPQNAPLIAAALSTIWEEKLRYGYQSAHTVVASDDSVILLAVTQIGPGALWVTVKIEISLA